MPPRTLPSVVFDWLAWRSSTYTSTLQSAFGAFYKIFIFKNCTVPQQVACLIQTPLFLQYPSRSPRPVISSSKGLSTIFSPILRLSPYHLNHAYATSPELTLRILSNRVTLRYLFQQSVPAACTMDFKCRI